MEENIDCDMAEVQISKDDDTDLESFERDEQRMEEEAAQVKIIITSRIMHSCTITLLLFLRTQPLERELVSLILSPTLNPIDNIEFIMVRYNTTSTIT